MKRIGIITAMAKEMLPVYSEFGDVVGSETFFNGAVYRYSDRDNLYFVATSGIGSIYAAAATELLIERYKVEAIVNFGLAGGLNPAYGVGDLVVAKRVVHHQFDLRGIGAPRRGQYENRTSPFWDTDEEIIERFMRVVKEPLPLAVIASGDAFVSDKKIKNELVKEFKADACDMESAGITIVAAAHNIPVFIMKMISDKAEEQSAAEYEKCVAQGIYNYKSLIKTICAAV
jgi:adenosylhomocysteine nucleosidase